MNREYSLLVFLSTAVIVLDQITKSLVVRTIEVYESIPVIKGFFSLVHIRNRGMAFGLMNRPDAGGGSYFLGAATIAAVLLSLYWFNRMRGNGRIVATGFSLVIGGALGNLIDRMRFKEVIDFLDFYIGSYHWPAFNVADSAITVGTFLVAFHMLFPPSPQE